MSVAIDESLRPILCAYNPFDDVARPQHADGRFSQVHVPAVLRAPREQLLAAIDAYRVRRFSALVDLPASRVIKVLGHRGAGKTHLYEAVLHREDGAPQLLISRDTENFDEGMPFEEYVFGKVPKLLPYAEWACVEAERGRVSVSLHRVELDRAALRASVAGSSNPLASWLSSQYA